MVDFPSQELQFCCPFGHTIFEFPIELFGLHRCCDTIEYDADAVGELLQKHDLQVGEGSDRRKFDDRPCLVLKQYRQHDDILRRCLNKRRSDQGRIRRQILYYERSLVGGALTSKAFTDSQTREMPIGAIILSLIHISEPTRLR